jgi:ATP-binding cassette subfamily B protein
VKPYRRDFAIGLLATALQENLAGIRLIQAYQREQTESERFHQLNRELFRRNMAAAWERALYLPLIFWLGSATGGIILWLGGSHVISGRITLGEFVAFIGYVGLLAKPLTILGWVISLAQRAVVSLGRIEEILSIPPSRPRGEGRCAGAAPGGSPLASADCGV